MTSITSTKTLKVTTGSFLWHKMSLFTTSRTFCILNWLMGFDQCRSFSFNYLLSWDMRLLFFWSRWASSIEIKVDRRILSWSCSTSNRKPSIAPLTHTSTTNSGMVVVITRLDKYRDPANPSNQLIGSPFSIQANMLQSMLSWWSMRKLIPNMNSKALSSREQQLKEELRRALVQEIVTGSEPLLLT